MRPRPRPAGQFWVRRGALALVRSHALPGTALCGDSLLDPQARGCLGTFATAGCVCAASQVQGQYCLSELTFRRPKNGERQSGHS